MNPLVSPCTPRRRAIALAALALLGGTSAHAAPLSWDAVLREAAQSNPELREARESLLASDYLVNGSHSGFLPQVTAAYTFSHSGDPTGAAQSASTGSLTATQNLFSGFQDLGKVKQAKANHEVAQAAFDATRAKVSYDLKSAFAGLRSALDMQKLTLDIIQRRKENHRLVELRFEGGRENKGSLLRAGAFLTQARYEHLQANHALDLARKQLKKVLGRPLDEDEAELSLSDDLPLQDPPKKIDFKALALQTPDHRKSVHQEDSALAALKIARAPFFPSVSVSGTYSLTGTDVIPETNKWSVGATLSWSLFSGGKDYYATRSASASSAAASANVESTDLGLLSKLKLAHSGYVEAVEKLKADQAFLEAARLRAEIARKKYNNGLLSFEDWDSIENDLIVRQRTVLTSQRDRQVAEAAWEQAQGRGQIP